MTPSDPHPGGLHIELQNIGKQNVESHNIDVVFFNSMLLIFCQPVARIFVVLFFDILKFDILHCRCCLFDILRLKILKFWYFAH